MNNKPSKNSNDSNAMFLQQKGNNRKGISVLLVLATLAITFAMSYAILYTQTMSSQIQFNSELNFGAKQVAATGMSIALRKMHESSWPGVDTIYSDYLSANQWFEVTYTTGDASLAEGDSEYSKYPYRVTLLATGYASDPSNSSMITSHQIEVVVQLIPRALTAEPTNWAEANNYTYFQKYTGSDDGGFKTTINIPSQINGPCRFQAQLCVCKDYPGNSNATHKWLADALTIKNELGNDYRPFTSTLHLKEDATAATDLAYLASSGIATENHPSLDLTLTCDPGLSTYQLYPGGELYNIEMISNELKDDTLAPDQVSNPLGIFIRGGTITIKENVNIQGTIITKNSNSDIRIEKENVTWVPVDLLPLHGTSNKIQIPAALPGDKFKVEEDGKITMQGMIVAGGEFKVKEADQDENSISLTGRIISPKLKIEKRKDWDEDNSWWQTRWSDHDFSSMFFPYPLTPRFPIWLQMAHELNPEPKIKISPPTGVSYHWTTFDQPIYAAHAADPGLMWDLIRWTDSP